MSWEHYILNDICKSISDGDHQPPPKAENGIPFVTIANITNANKFDFSNTMFVPQEYYDKLDDKRRAHMGDILYSVVGSFGIPVYMSEEQKFVFQRHIAILRPDETKVVPQFLYYTMLSRDFYMKADAVALGAAQRTVSLTSLRGMDVAVPDLEIQKKIVDILKPYDELIENNQKQIKLLEEAAQRLYKEWFVDLRFPGYEEVEFVDGVPRGWTKTSILDNEIFCLSKTRLKPFDGEKEYYATADVTNTYFTTNGELISFDNKPSRAQFEPTLNSVWFARMSNSYKIIGFTKANINRLDKIALSSGFCGFEASSKNWGYVYCTISSDSFNSEKDRYATGATQVSLTNDGLKKIEVLIPSAEIIEQFGIFVNPIINKIIYLYEYNFSLQEARDRLLPKLMSGEIEV